VVIEPAPSNWSALEIVIGRIRAYISKRTGGAPPFDVEVNRHGVSEVDAFDGLVEVANPAIQSLSVLVPPRIFDSRWNRNASRASSSDLRNSSYG